MFKSKLLLLFSLLLITTATTLVVQAADSTKRQTIIVLDASGSMWGQVDGKAKIDVAREVIKELLEGWDTNVLLGITAYGHRSKGDCSDIESVYPVSTLNKATALSVVNAIKPKGMTPLSQAVKTAAEELKYTENKATVILLSDGKETCELDPCALGKSLEEKGVDFTAHVIGFDVSLAEQAGLKCLAENTGGVFLAASNSAQLKSALAETARIVAEKPPAITGKGKLWLDKTEFSVGEPITVHFEASDKFHDNAWVGIVPSSIEHGSESRNDQYDVSYQYLKKRTSGTLTFKAPGRIEKYDFRMNDTDHSGNEVATVSFTVKEIGATLSLDKTDFLTGQQIKLHFKTGAPFVADAWVGIVPSSIPHGNETVNDQNDLSYQRLGGKTEGTLTFVAPGKPGAYDLRLNDTDKNGNEVASVSFKVGQSVANLSIDKTEVSAGAPIIVTYKVPEGLATDAWIGIVPSAIPHGDEAKNDAHDVSYQYLRGKAAGVFTFKAPTNPGQYDFRAHDTDKGGGEIGSVSFTVK